MNLTDKTKMIGYLIILENEGKIDNDTAICKQITHAPKRQSYITTYVIMNFEILSN